MQIVELRNAWRQWMRDQLPDHTPDRIRDLFWTSVWMATLTAIAAAVRIYTMLSTPEHYREWSFSEIAGFSAGMTGAVLAYGIKTERRYSRPLIIAIAVVIIGEALWNIGRIDFTTEDIAIIVGAVLLIKYLSSEEVRAYYSALHTGKTASPEMTV